MRSTDGDARDEFYKGFKYLSIVQVLLLASKFPAISLSLQHNYHLYGKPVTLTAPQFCHKTAQMHKVLLNPCTLAPV